MTVKTLTVNRNTFKGTAANRLNRPQRRRYYRLLAKKHIGQLDGQDLTIYETGHEMWLSDEEAVIKALEGVRFVDAEEADESRARYTRWLRDCDFSARKHLYEVFIGKLE